MPPLLVAMQDAASRPQVPLNVMGVILIAAGGLFWFSLGVIFLAVGIGMTAMHYLVPEGL